jgi:peptidoglycan hydrolase-like protein with peptidoglycan-binding domain
MAVGITGSGFDGVFGYGTRNALMNYQRRKGLPATGIADCRTWINLSNAANGIGATSKVIV